MAIFATTTGNLLENPVQRSVKTAKGMVKVTELRIMSDVWKNVADDQLVQDDERSSPVQVTVWNEHLGERVMKLLSKGMRIKAEGDMYLHSYEPSDQERQTAAAGGRELKSFHGLRMTAETITLSLNRVESVVLTPKRDRASVPAESGTETA